MPFYQSLISFLEKRSNCSTYFTPKTPATQSYRQPNKNMPSHSHTRTFLTTKKSNKLSTIQQPTPTNQQPLPTIQQQSSTLQTKYPPPLLNASKNNTAYPCPICKEIHSVYKCNKFILSSIPERVHMAKNSGLCPNCLGKGHSLEGCKGGNCRVCEEKHHTYLHPTLNQGSIIESI